MQIKLEQIIFNLDPDHPGNDKLDARYDSMDSFPEWRDVDEFLIAHVRADGSPCEIKARFSSPDLSLSGSRVEVQGTPVGPNVMGEVPVVAVDFDSAGTAEVSVCLPHSKLEGGVQSCTVAWEWSYRAKGDAEWTPFRTTRQRLYCTIGPPTEPWKKPWPAVLEWACRWANRAANEVEAGTKITKAVFDLGRQGKVVYATDGGPTYAHKNFNCAGFLQLLNNAARKPKALNCDDCATIVSTFANILGCDLNQSEIGYKFWTNYICLIGSDHFGTTRFTKHAVAWKDKCSKNDPLYDACLQLDVDGDPFNLKGKGHKAGLPSNLKFGTGVQNDYKFCLVRKGQNAYPNPLEKQRRPIADSHLGSRSFKGGEYAKILKDHYGFDSWPKDKSPLLDLQLDLSSLLVEFIKAHSAFAGWESTEMKRFNDDGLDRVDRITLSPKTDQARLVELYLYIATYDPNVFLLQLLAQFDSTQIRRRNSDLIGALVLAEENQSLNLVKYHQVIGLVRSVGKTPVSTTQMGQALEQFVSSLGSASNALRSDSHTALPSKTISEHTIGEPNMTHKLAQSWPCHIGGYIGLDREGHMDLSSMDDEGDLEYGWYYVNNERHRLKGKAVGATPLRITLEEYEEYGHDGNEPALLATYDGTLVYENSTSETMVIVGTVHYVQTERARNPDQNDPPWVITKP